MRYITLQLWPSAEEPHELERAIPKLSYFVMNNKIKSFEKPFVFWKQPVLEKILRTVETFQKHQAGGLTLTLTVHQLSPKHHLELKHPWQPWHNPCLCRYEKIVDFF